MKIPSSVCPAETSSKDEIPSSVGDFSEYMWMENEEEFEEEVMKQLEEEALMEQCIEAMLQDELESNENIISSLGNLQIEDKSDLVKKSTLNPNAAEFIPFSTVEESPEVITETLSKEGSKDLPVHKKELLENDPKQVDSSSSLNEDSETSSKMAQSSTPLKDIA